MGIRADRRQTAAELGMLIARSRRMMSAVASQRLEARGESMLVWQVLNRLRREGPLTQSELAFQTGQHPAGICRLLEALEGEGMVERTRDAEDRRKLQVALTGRAHKRLAATDPAVYDAAEHFLRPLSALEQRTLRDLLRKLVEAR